MMRLFVIIVFLLASMVFAEGRYAYEGVTEPIARAVVSATVPGRIDSILVAEGAFVAKGQVVITLEKEEEAINEAIAKLLAASKSDLVSTQKKAETFEKDYRAVKKLFETSNSVSEDQVWEKELNFKLAEAEFQKQNMVEEREVLESRMASVQLAKRVIRAPFDGVIVKINKNPSESVQALEPLFEIVDVRQCRMVVYVVAPEAQGLRRGMELTLELDGSRTSRTRKGKVDFVSPVVDRSSMLRTVKVVFDNTNGSIEPGVTGRLLKNR
jgi:RND family efflux transporter MFP subunit